MACTLFCLSHSLADTTSTSPTPLAASSGQGMLGLLTLLQASRLVGCSHFMWPDASDLQPITSNTHAWPDGATQPAPLLPCMHAQARG